MFNDNLFNFNQMEVFASSILIMSKSSFTFLCLENKFVSSANIMNSVILDVLTMSFTKSVNNSGPEIYP